MSFAVALALATCLLAPSALIAGPPVGKTVADLKALEATFVTIADEIRPSVVAIRTYHHRRGTGDKDSPGFRSPRMRARNQGTGMIISGDGFILTNNHVVVGADEVIAILHDGREETARLVQTDVRNDLAVVKIAVEHLRAVRFRDVKDVRVGQWTLAVGNPFGLADFGKRTSVTVGNVSALGRNLTTPLSNGRPNDRYYGNLIETSAAINPGNSGGPLFNLDGEVIGVITAIETRSGVSEGLGFAIPIDRYTRRIIDTLVRGKQVRYGYLGVVVESPRFHGLRALGSDSLRGAYVTDVPEGEPAAHAGLQRNDLIIAFDGEPVESPDHLIRLVGATTVGRASEVKIIRDGKEISKTVVLSARPTPGERPRRTEQRD